MKTMFGALAIVTALTTNPVAAPGNTDHSANYYLPGCRDFVNKQFAREPFLQGECIGILACQ
jgi:hypothetical protein